MKILDRVHTFHNEVYHRDIGTPASLAKAQLEFSSLTRACSGKPEAGDPWFGMMAENGGALARDFARAAEAAYPRIDRAQWT